MKSLWALIGRVVYYTAGVVALPIFLHNTERSRVAIINKSTNQILLSKTWLSSQQWQLVGGGARKDEDFLVAAVREVNEETGLDLNTDQLTYLGDMSIKEYMATYQAHMFAVYVNSTDFKPARFELLDMAWHKLDSLPANCHHETINYVKNKLK